VSLARGAASAFEMRIIPERRAGQITMPKKIMGRVAAASAALKSGTRSSSGNLAGLWSKQRLRPSKRNARSFRATRPLCPFTPKAGVNGDPKSRVRLTPVRMTKLRKDCANIELLLKTPKNRKEIEKGVRSGERPSRIYWRRVFIC